MLPVIENLLILQDRDRKIARLQRELNNIAPERAMLQTKAQREQAELDAAKLKVKQIETDRKRLELEVESKKTLIEKYGLQQFQTKKNEEYRALAHEMETARGAIRALEDQQIELMEAMETAQKEMAAKAAIVTEAQKHVDSLVSALGDREKLLARQLTELKEDHAKLQGNVEEGALDRYSRLRKSKGDNMLVGISHSVCGGCHMKLPMQIVVTCQAQEDLVTCPNCGRLLYFTSDMNLAIVD